MSHDRNVISPLVRRFLGSPRSGLALCITGAALCACSGELGPENDAAGAAEGPRTPSGEQSAETATAPSGPVAGSSASAGSDGSIDAVGSSTPTTDGSIPSGSTTGSPGDPRPMTPSASSTDCEAVDTGENVLRRLTRLELQLTLKELFRLNDIPPLQSVPPDSDFKGFRTLSALQSVTTEHLRGYQKEATALAEELLADATRAQTIVGCDVASAGCLESFIDDFGRAAYRRALREDEVTSLLDVAAATGGSAEEQFTAVVSAMLSSASFLFRMELGDTPEGLSRLNGEELASRLSFTLIGRGPSRELLDRGAAGELDSNAGLAAAAAELLADERAQEYYRGFFKQWLDFEQLRAPNDPGPDWNDAIMLSMTEETERFLDEYAWTPGVHFLDSLIANHSTMRADLAEFYGLPAPAGNGLVEFPEDHDRYQSGLLTHASLISAKGDGDRIAHRGAWVQKTFMCIEMTIPTSLLDELSDELEGLTYPQMLDMRNTETACAGCHALIDPIGVGFHQYDAAGQFRADVDPLQFGITPALPGIGEFDSIGELSAMLRKRPEVAQCLSQRLFLYSAGREPTATDRCAVSAAAERFATDQGRFASMLEGLVLSPQFRMRRAPAAPAL